LITVDNVIQFPHDYGREHLVLIVDDDPAIRGMLSEFLQGCGYQTITSSSGDEAVVVLESGHLIDLVFSDVHMPGKLDGFGLARWIMENKPGLPLILVSGDLGKTNAALELFGAEMFPKPYDLGAAVRKIRETLNRSWRKRGQ
jgi:CheY-like chemotaxis protein